MKRYAIYPSGAGVKPIRRVGICNDQDFDSMAGAGESAIEVGPEVLDTTHYILNGVCTPRAAMALTMTPSNKVFIADGAAEMQISGIPAGTLASWTTLLGVSLAYVNDGVFKVSTNLVGPIRIRLDPPVHLPEEIQVLAVAP